MFESLQGNARTPPLGDGRSSARQTVMEIFRLAVPIGFGYLVTLINEVVNTVCIGQDGSEAELAAVGLGNMMQNCMALSIGFGFAQALDTLVSQAHGADQNELSCHYLQRCRVLLTLQLLWMVPLLCLSDTWLQLIHQDPDVSADAARYNRAATIGLFFCFQFEATRKFLTNRQWPNGMAVIAGVCSLLHIVWAWFFIVHMRMGNAGAGMANTTTWILQFLLGQAFLLYNARSIGVRARDVLWVQPVAFREWGSFMRVAFPATVQLCSEWWFWEICALVVGYIGTDALAAHVSTLNFVALCFMPTLAVSSTASTLVGNALGANLPSNAKLAAWLCVAVNIGVWTATTLSILIFRDLICKLYTSQTHVQDIMKRLLLIYLAAGYFDNAQNIMGGALRGMGHTRLPAIVYLAAFYAIMLPVGCVFSWPLHMGVYGMWWSMVVGTCLATIVFTIALHRVDWTSLAKEASDKMRKEGCRVGNDLDEVGTNSMLSLAGA